MSTFKRMLLSAAAMVPLLLSGTAHAQWWALNGNAIAPTDYLGTWNTIDFRIFTNSLQRMTIAKGGAVGIGTTTPNTTTVLHINTSPSAPQLLLDEGGSTTWDLWAGGDFNFRRTNLGVTTTWMQFEGGVNQNMEIGPNSQIYLASGGGVGIGIGGVAPPTKLTVNGDITPGADCSYSIGTSARRWNIIYACNGTIQTSDAAMKENIQGISYGLNTVMQLHPVSFTWKDDPAYGRKLGLIAQELQPVVSEVVKVSDDSSSMGVYYSDLIPVLVKAIQDQQKKIETRATENRVLRAQLNERIARIARLEAAFEAGTESEPGAEAR